LQALLFTTLFYEQGNVSERRIAMTTSTIPVKQWLKNVQEEYRNLVKQSAFYKKVASASSVEDFQWIRQLYYLSCDFTAAVALRYGSCRDPRFRDAFGEHAAEEVTHPADLTEWMREFGFLAAGEEPMSVPPTFETLALGSYFLRSAIREPIPHQIITLNLMIEGMACDFYAAVNPKLAELGLTPKGYWAVHAKADMKHQILGLDLIPQSDPGSPSGKLYARTAWEVASLWSQEFEAWGDVPIERRLKLPSPAELALS
jgi:hypothetical protein